MRFLLLALLLAVHLSAEALTAKSYIAMDMDGNVVLEQNPDDVRAMASITKLITMEKAAQLDPNEIIEVTHDDVRSGRMRWSPLRPGSKWTRAQLMQLALISSDNIAAIALGRTAAQATVFLPAHTTYVEASGLDAGDKSTAREVAELARSLYKTEIANTSVQPNVLVGKNKIHSTNPLLTQRGWTFYLSKTGYTTPAGGCLVVITEINGKLMTIAIMGSADTHARWRDLAELRRDLGDSNFAFVLQNQVQKLKRKMFRVKK